MMMISSHLCIQPKQAWPVPGPYMGRIGRLRGGTVVGVRSDRSTPTRPTRDDVICVGPSRVGLRNHNF
jgi:hypothetical protein